MNRLQHILVGAIVIGILASTLTAFPLMNVVLYDNADGWFTMDNIDDYGDDLDSRSNNTVVVFTAHPSYVMGSDDARLLFDRPRIHYFAITLRGTELGDQQYERIATALRDGRVSYAINDNMTTNMLQWDGAGDARQALRENYCAVQEPDTQQLYNQTGATLHEYVGNDTCAPGDRPSVMP